jgi:hypothetical protein
MRVFHITFANRLPSIAERGLDPLARGPFSTGGYAAHSRNRNFFTADWPGVLFWTSRYEDFANDGSDTPIEDGLVPVVLAMDVDDSDLMIDDVSRRESTREDFFATKPIPPEDIEVFCDGEWYGLQEAVDDDLIDPSKAGEEDDDGENVWVTFKAESPFMPLESELMNDEDKSMAENPAAPVTKTQATAAWVQLGRPRVDVEQLRMGMEVELEHGGSLLDAAKVAVDHLDEFGDYYTRLGKMEDRAKKGLPPNPLTPNGSSMRAAFDQLFAVLDEQFPDFGTLTLIEDDDAHDGGRHYAYCSKTDDGAEIAFAGVASVNLQPDNMRAMMAHEMGHALDFRYGKKGLSKALGVTLSADGELRADQIAEAVFGFPISYDAKCAYLQTTGRGVYPRPSGLR